MMKFICTRSIRHVLCTDASVISAILFFSVTQLSTSAQGQTDPTSDYNTVYSEADFSETGSSNNIIRAPPALFEGHKRLYLLS